MPLLMYREIRVMESLSGCDNIHVKMMDTIRECPSWCYKTVNLSYWITVKEQLLSEITVQQALPHYARVFGDHISA